MKYRLQDAFAHAAHAAKTAWEDMNGFSDKEEGPSYEELFLIMLFRDPAMREVLTAAGLSWEQFELSLKTLYTSVPALETMVARAAEVTYDPAFELSEDSYPEPESIMWLWINNSVLHAMSVGRPSGIVDVYDMLITVRTFMPNGPLSSVWDLLGFSLLKLRQGDAFVHGPEGLYRKNPPASCEWLADALDDWTDPEEDEEAVPEPESETADDRADDPLEAIPSEAPRANDGSAPSESEGEADEPRRSLGNLQVMSISLDPDGKSDDASAVEALRKIFAQSMQPILEAAMDSQEEAAAEAPAASDKKTLTREERFLRSCTRNLMDEAEAGLIDPLIGRNEEIGRICEILCCRRKNKPLILGEAGSGKTALVEGLALRIVKGEVPPALRGLTLYSLNASSLISRYKGAFAEKLAEIESVLRKMPEAVLVIDNIHALVSGSDNNSQEEYHAIGQLVSNDRLRVIATSSFRAWRQTFSKDETLVRRLQPVELKAVTKDEAEDIVNGLLSKFEAYHGVRYADDVVRRAVALADRWITDRAFPDKAIDLIDELGGAAKVSRERDDKSIIDVTSEGLPALVARIARIPVDQVGAEEHGELADLDKKIRSTVFGQDEAVDAIVSAIRMSRSGLGSPERPVGSFLFTGPTGVGKTEVARQLALGMGIPLLRFDMSEYSESHTVSRLIGSPPGYVGYGEGGLLTEQVAKHPYSVVLLDEMEKAHPSLFNLLLQVMDHGKLTDASGREADFRNTVIIMTSNVGARELERSTIGFGGGMSGDEGQAVKKAFTPEFRNRLDAIVHFAPLSRESVALVVDKFLVELTTQLAARDVTPDYTSAFRAWLAEHGYDPHMGARPMRRLIADKVRRPLADELLFGRLCGGGAVTLDVRRDDDGVERVVLDIKKTE